MSVRFWDKSRQRGEHFDCCMIIWSDQLWIFFNNVEFSKVMTGIIRNSVAQYSKEDIIMIKASIWKDLSSFTKNTWVQRALLRILNLEDFHYQCFWAIFCFVARWVNTLNNCCILLRESAECPELCWAGADCVASEFWPGQRVENLLEQRNRVRDSEYTGRTGRGCPGQFWAASLCPISLKLI